MPETCENLPGLLNNGVYFARQTCEIYQVLPYMMRSSNGTIFRVTGPFVRGIHRWPVNSPHKGQWRGALVFSLIYAWITV